MAAAPRVGDAEPGAVPTAAMGLAAGPPYFFAIIGSAFFSEAASAFFR